MNLAETVWKERYAQHGEESWKDSAKRIAVCGAKAEENTKFDEWLERFYAEISKFNFIPGGRILSNSGKTKQFMMNCNVLGLEDSRESIGQLIKDTLIVSGTGGGVGVSFSRLRPKGSGIQTSGGTSSGPISFMHCLDTVAGTIKTGGGRRAALMISLSIYHPDIMDFLHEKLDLHKLSNANISVEIDNKFIQAVKDNDMWPLIWAGKVWREYPAREIWDKIIENAWKVGEPGILNLGYIRDMSNSEYFNPIFTTNPCGELPLPEYSSCCLGSINIANFVRGKNLDIQGLKQAIEVGVRYLDNIVTVNEYPLETIKLNATSDRRIGLGLTGLHYAMLKLGLKYSSDEAIGFTEKIYEILRNHSYWVSSELSMEKGAFPLFNADSYLRSRFIKSLPSKIRQKIRECGIRNVCLNTQAPTGTTSLLAGVSSGIEPIFSPVYERRYYSEDKIKKEVIADPMLLSMIEEGKDVNHFEGAYDIKPERHLAIQESAQRYIDSAVSKTINLPEKYPVDKLSDLLLEYIPTLKGVTIYREGSRGESPLKVLDPKKYLEKATAGENKTECGVGGCDE